MKTLRWIVIILAVLNFGFMTVDGSRALIVGDYFRPETGEYAGQLGPWATIVSAIGINPESGLMKGIFIAWGGLGLILTVSFAMRVRRADSALLFFNLASFWYLVAGTLSSVLQVIFLLILRFNNKRS
jgi:hypothetical protein